MMVVPIGGNDTPALPLAWGWAAGGADVGDVGAALCVGFALAELAGLVAALLDDVAVLGGAVALPGVVPAAVLELDDPPHAASSRTSDPSPAAAAHLLLRITSVSFGLP
jgi:hypothetical protein